MTEETEHYGVLYIQTKEKDFRKVLKEAAEYTDKNKVYIQVVPNDALMVQVSMIDKDVMDSIDIWRAKGYDPQIQTGKPGGCPPGGCG